MGSPESLPLNLSPEALAKYCIGKLEASPLTSIYLRIYIYLYSPYHSKAFKEKWYTCKIIDWEHLTNHENRYMDYQHEICQVCKELKYYVEYLGELHTLTIYK